MIVRRLGCVMSDLAECRQNYAVRGRLRYCMSEYATDRRGRVSGLRLRRPIIRVRHEHDLERTRCSRSPKCPCLCLPIPNSDTSRVEVHKLVESDYDVIDDVTCQVGALRMIQTGSSVGWSQTSGKTYSTCYCMPICSIHLATTRL